MGSLEWACGGKEDGQPKTARVCQILDGAHRVAGIGGQLPGGRGGTGRGCKAVWAAGNVPSLPGPVVM